MAPSQQTHFLITDSEELYKETWAAPSGQDI